MKLLPKQQVAIQGASDRKAQIDEGITLARKVDALRETLASLESQHAQFLDGMERELCERTDGLFSQIGELQKEIKELEEKRKIALIPLDAQWSEVREKMTENDQIMTILAEKTDKLAQKEQIQDERDKKSLQRVAVANSRDRESVKEWNRILEIGKETDKIHAETLARKIEQDKISEQTKKRIIERESAVASYEFTLKAREEQLDIQEEEIVKEKRQVSSQRAILERAIRNTKHE